MVVQAWVRAAPPAATALAAYATVKNPCASAIVIAGVSGPDFGMSMIHETRVVKGVSQMRDVESMPIPAMGEVRLAPGGSHIMLMQARRKFKEGDKVRLLFRLADGRVFPAEFVVRRE